MDVLVVDDASPDFRGPPHLKRIAKRHLRRRRWGILRTPRPLGFGGAINWALSRVRTDADFLLFVHDDAVLDQRAVERMVYRLEVDEGTAIVGPKIVRWDDVTRLEEVGMAVDRFGYPYKGLEEGEIDLGQHDTPSEVFFVTSTCMLVRHEVFRQLRGWDSRMHAFSEDLDLCWRARIAGHGVVVEPGASVRHAIALATGQRSSPFVPARYFGRRNRLRAVMKNASALRLVVLLPQFFFVTLAEMVGFIVLRQPSEIVNLAKALGWNLLRTPDTIGARRRAQRARRIGDRRLGRLTVREWTRIRAYVTNQTERLEQAWGQRAELVTARGSQARAFGHRMRGLPTVIAIATALALIIGFRHYIWAPPASVGDLLPYPQRATALWRVFFSPWQPAGLGQPGPAPPAFALLGIIPLLTLGAAGVAQKLLLATIAIFAFVGAYRLVGELVDRAGRFAAAFIYLLGGVGYAGLRSGDLGALMFGAAAPYALHSLLRLTGWVRPSRFRYGREVAALGIASAAAAAFAPGAVLLLAAAGIILALGRAVLAPAARWWRGLVAGLVGTALGWVLLLPWSLEWWSKGGPLWWSTSSPVWRDYAAAYRGTGALSVLLGQTPDVPILYGVALCLLGAMAVVVAVGQRRRLALALWMLVVASAWLVQLTASGTLRPVVASPTQASVIAAIGFAALAGIAAGAPRLDLPRRELGLVHAIVLGGLAAGAALLAGGALPAIWHGNWDPGRGTHQVSPEVVDQINTVIGAPGAEPAEFRALWVGPGWASRNPSAANPPAPVRITGPRGQVLTDLYRRGVGAGTWQLDGVVRSVESGATDHAGGLLGAFNVHYVVIERTRGAGRWLAQRDLALVRTEPRYLLMENQSDIARAALYERLPRYVSAMSRGAPATVAYGEDALTTEAEQRSPASFGAPDVSGPGVVFLAEERDRRWTASVGSRRLSRLDGGWGNAFGVPAGSEGPLNIAYDRPLSSYVWLVLIGLAWAATLSAAFSRRARRVTEVAR